MNERIRELAEQAYEYSNIPNSDGVFNKEKFAELIVLECATIADKDSSQPCASYGELIKQHFGVE
jgi:hypothetical protein